MKTVKFLTKQLGEYSITPRELIAPWDEEKRAEIEKEYCINWEEDAGCIHNWDFWVHDPKKRWAIEEVKIPEWMTPEEYIENRISWLYYRKMFNSEEEAESFGKERFREYYILHKFMLKNPVLALAMVKLLKTKKFRSEFRKSLRNQLEDWMDGKSEYSEPFSALQVKKLCDPYITLEAQQRGIK